jgi:hypothetical protein
MHETISLTKTPHTLRFTVTVQTPFVLYVGLMTAINDAYILFKNFFFSKHLLHTLRDMGLHQTCSADVKIMNRNII